MPSDIRSWKQNAQIALKGLSAVKTVTRTCRLKDGSEKVLSMTVKREFDI